MTGEVTDNSLIIPLSHAATSSTKRAACCSRSTPCRCRIDAASASQRLSQKTRWPFSDARRARRSRLSNAVASPTTPMRSTASNDTTSAAVCASDAHSAASPDEPPQIAAARRPISKASRRSSSDIDRNPAIPLPPDVDASSSSCGFAPPPAAAATAAAARAPTKSPSGMARPMRRRASASVSSASVRSSSAAAARIRWLRSFSRHAGCPAECAMLIES